MSNQENSIYVPSELGKSLRQGEILTDLLQVIVKLDSIKAKTKRSSYKAEDVKHPFAIVVTQDCDLEQDFTVRSGIKSGQHRVLPSILFCELHLADDLFHNPENVYHGVLNQSKSSTIRTQFINNKDERFHFLQKTAPHQDILGEGLPELAVTFNRYFTLPADEVYSRIKMGYFKRRCRLISPYLEHFAVRFHYYHYRVALPNDHASE